MNKRFFTLMAAVMLAGSPFAATEAFAALVTTENPVGLSSPSVTFKNGTKFVINTATGYYETKEVTNTATGITYATLSNATGSSLTNAAVFEATKVSVNALGITFELSVNGKPFALVKTAAAVKKNTAADKILTTFTSAAPASGSTYKLDGMTLELVEPASSTTSIAGAGRLCSKSLDYNAVSLNEFNASSTTFSFPGEGLVGNVFEGVIPVSFNAAGDLGTGSVAGTYFVKGAAADIKALKDAGNSTDRTAALKKLSVVSVLNEKYGLNSKTLGEGYKLALISGAEFYKTSGAKFENAAFTGIEENDQLNNEGELVLTIKPFVGTPAKQETVNIAAVKASASDTKTYVTTVATSGSLFDTKSNPTLGSNTFFAASDFLNAGEVSAYNVFFTSGDPVSAGQQPMEYGRYLSVVSDGVSYKLHATSPDSTIVNAPLSQWIVTNFDGKYTLSLRSREGNQAMSLRLEATDSADEYKIANDGGAALTIANIKPLANDGVTTINTLVGRTIKLIPTTLTKNDGYVVLSKEDMSGTIAVSFSGKDAIKGSQTYYMTPDATTPTKFVPTLKASDAAELNFALNEAVPADDYITTDYAYLDKDGRVMTDAVDTLVVPSYTVTYKVGTTPYYVTANDFSVTASTTGAPASTKKVVLKKHLSGSYALGIYDKAKQAAPVNATAVKPNGAAFVSASKKLNALQDADFAYVSLGLEDQNDYTTLEAVSRHATFESAYGSVAMQENKNGILEGILSAAPLTFWLDTADSEKATPAFYISVGIKGEEEAPATKADAAPVMRNFLYNPADSSVIYNPGSATSSKVEKYFLEGTNKANLKAIFRPAALVAEDTLVSVVDGKEVAVVTEKADATKGQVNGLKNFQYRISLADPDVEGEYVVKSKAGGYLYSLNGRLGFTNDKKEAWIFTLGEGDATANEAIAAEAGVQVIGGQGVVTVQGAAGKVITVANILGQTIANQVAASDNVTIAAPAGVVVVAVDGEATKVVVK